MLCKANHMTLQATDLTTCMVLFFEETFLVVHAEIRAQITDRLLYSFLVLLFLPYILFYQKKKLKTSDVSLFSCVILLFLSDS